MHPFLAFTIVPPAITALVLLVRICKDEARIARGTVAANLTALVVAIIAVAGGSDPLSGCIAVAVGGIALLVSGYAARSLHGSSIPYQRFFAVLELATAASLAIAVATDVRVLAIAWILTGAATSTLLASAAHPAAQHWARRHAAVEVIGDVAWIVICALVWRVYGTFDLARLPDVVTPGAAATAVGIALVVAGAARSALVPLHSWLPNSMEAPTPVSAFMHAGLVNGAGVLFVKCAFFLVMAPAALALAAILGGVTVLIGAAVASVRPESKRRLGWSTVAQMGFMVLQCGCGAFAAAVVHLIAHGGYKAAAFLGVPGSIRSHQSEGARTAQRVQLHPLVAIGAALAPATLGVLVAYAVAPAALSAMPASVAVVALAWMTAVSATRAIVDRALDPLARIFVFAAAAASVPVYLAVVAALDAWIGHALPQLTVVPTTGVVAAIAVAIGLIAACGFRMIDLPAADRIYALAVVEGRGVPLPTR